MLSLRYISVLVIVVCFGAYHTTATVEVVNDESKDLVSDLILLGIIKKYLSLFYPTTANGACGNHSVQYKQGVKDRKLWAMKMFDASTKFPSGFLAGNINQLGNYDECVRVDAPDAGTGYGAFTGQHCYVYINAKPDETGTSSALLSEEEQYFMQDVHEYLHIAHHQLGDRRQSSLPNIDERAVSGIQNIPSFIGFRWSFCVPSSCSASDVTSHLTNGMSVLGLAGTAQDVDCHTRETEPFTWVYWFCISLMILLGLLAALSTSYDLLIADKESRRPLLLAFSLYSNGKRLLDTTSTGSDVLPAVHGVRFLSIAWVMYCHRWALASANPNPSLDFYLDFITDPGRMYIRNGGLSVDSFFLLSGMLVCYIFLKEMEKGTSFNAFFYYLHRYLRLTPPVAMMIFFQVSVYSHLGSGPLWNFAQWEGNACKENWWIDLLYVQNYVNNNLVCLTQTWYLAVDMQFFWFSPLVLLPLWKWPKIGKPFLGLLIAASIATVFAISYVEEAHIGGGVDSTATHMRSAVWLIGIGLGYLLHITKKERPILRKWMVLTGWAAALFLVFGSIYLMAPFVTNSPLSPVEYHRLLHAFLLAIFRPAFALGLAWIVYACVRGYGGFINSFLSWSFFIPLSRLSYCIYLTHMAVQYALLGSMKSINYFDDSTVIPQFFSDMVISTGCAAILSLLVEAPTMIIEKSIFSKNGKKSSP